MDKFTTEHESFLMDDEPEYDVFDFDDACSIDLITEVVSACDTFVVSLDLKLLPDSLKYAFLRHDESLPMIIASYLNLDQDKKLLNVLRENKEALKWTLGDIKGISHTIGQHMIHIEGGVRLYQDYPRRSNLTL